MMERDSNISKLIKESGLVKAPDSFSEMVMKKIGVEPGKVVYKPLIGRFGRILIFLFIAGIVAVSIGYSESGGRLLDNVGILSGINWQLPQISFSFDFLSEINISAWLASTLVAIFLLVLSDAGLNRRRKRLV
jgi:hypothetical protein